MADVIRLDSSRRPHSVFSESINKKYVASDLRKLGSSARLQNLAQTGNCSLSHLANIDRRQPINTTQRVAEIGTRIQRWQFSV